MRSPVLPSCILVAALGFASAASAEDLKARTGLKALEYQPSEHPMPNYLPGEKWGTEGEQINRMQLPLSPADSAVRVVLPDGFESKLWAAEPEIVKPVTMAWDERGRLWIAETFDYPNELKPDGQGRDRIKICEDTDGDGRADKFTVFAENLSIPTGMCFANGGLVVIENGQTLFLKDTNGDDKADERRVLFKGWGTGDTHATASNIRTGFDNWIWGVVGYSGFDGEVGGRRVRFGMGVFRFRPDGSELEFIRSSNNNTWGLGFSEEGVVFGSTANNNASWYMPIPNRFYEAVSGWSSTRMETIADSQQFYPVTSHVRQVDAHGRYTAGAGHALYTARSFPKDYWNRVAFVTEPTGHLIGKFRLTANGADFASKNEHTFLASDDEWFAPIMAEVGPDGALWYIDWYNYIIQHNPTPHGFKTGKGNAYETPLRDKRHGRIYRVTHSQGRPSMAPKLAGAPANDLVTALKSDNLLWRLHAQRLLIERRDPAAVAPLVALVRDARVDDLGLNTGAIHALWTLQGLGAIDANQGDARAAALGALRHVSVDVRRTALQVLPRNAESGRTIRAGASLRDPDAQVRLAAFLALAELPPDDATGQAIADSLVKEPLNASDRWIRDAVASAGARHAEGFVAGVLASAKDPADKGSEVVRIVARHYARMTPATIAGTLQKAGGAPAGIARAFVDGIAAGWPENTKPTLSASDESALAQLIQRFPDDTRSALIALADRWGRKAMFASEVTALSGRLRQQVSNASVAPETRLDAARRLVSLDDNASNIAAVLGQITPLVPPNVSGSLLNAVASSRLPATAGMVLDSWSQFTPAARRIALGILLRRTEWAATVLAAVESSKLQKTDLGQDLWNQLRNHSDGGISRRAQAIEKAAGTAPSNATMESTIQKLLPLAKQKGDLAKGRDAFEKNCLVCHALNGKGARIGPDLTGIGVRPKSELLAEIVDPNRSVEANYRLWTVTTKGGDTYAGRLDTETSTAIEILDTTNQKHVVQRSDIATLEASNNSIMPVGFDQLPVEDLAGILEYLAESAHAR